MMRIMRIQQHSTTSITRATSTPSTARATTRSSLPRPSFATHTHAHILRCYDPRDGNASSLCLSRVVRPLLEPLPCRQISISPLLVVSHNQRTLLLTIAL